jgi:RNA polymerase subunit RPABC4/transcription elongation factor Spt4/F0F1-type ATP synthase membrane subunit c/vacuolar-type H+-ATPase subunit K
MILPAMDSLLTYLTAAAAILGALLAALWLSLIIWALRDMRLRSRDPFAQILAALLVAVLPIVGVVIYLILRPPETLAEAYERALEEEALLQEIEERPVCPGCSRTVDEKWILCPHCHTRLKKACPDCHSLMDLQWNLCPFCGNQQVDPYKVDVVTAVTPPIPNHENEENTPPVKNKSADDTDAGLPSVPPADDSN